MPHDLCPTCGTNLVSLNRSELAPPAWVPTSVSAIGRDDQWAYYVCLGAVVILLLLAIALIRSRFGRALIAVRDHEAAAETVGINVAQVKVMAFALSALYAGIAGSCSVLVDPRRQRRQGADVPAFDRVPRRGRDRRNGHRRRPVAGRVARRVPAARISDTLPTHVGSLGPLKRVLGDPAAAPAIFGLLLILFVFVLPDGIVGGVRRVMASFDRRSPRGRRPCRRRQRFVDHVKRSVNCNSKGNLAMDLAQRERRVGVGGLRIVALCAVLAVIGAACGSSRKSASNTNSTTGGSTGNSSDVK